MNHEALPGTPARRFSIGQPAIRVEDGRLLLGQGRYTDDITLPGMVRGFVLRSTHAHARLLSIDVAGALRRPGVVAILTAQDYRRDGCAPTPCGVAGARAPDGRPAFVPPRHPLAGGKVRFVGDPIAFVLAETLDAARDAAEAIDVAYDPLPAVLAPAEAMRADTAVWDERPDNVSFVHEAGDAAATAAAFARAAHVVRGRFVIPRVAISPLEVRGCVCAFDDASRTWRVDAGVQDVFSARRVLAEVLGEPETRFAVVSPDVGGSFGLKGIDPELVLTVWAARRLGRPVKWVADRSEAFASDNHGRDTVTEAALALEWVEVRIAPTGNALVVAGSTDQGQGHRTMYTQIVCDRLGLDPDAVQMVEADTNRLPAGGMTGSSRVSAMGSGAALKAAAMVMAKARQIAAHALEAAAEDIVVAGPRFVVAGTDRAIDLAEVARRAHEPSLLPPGLEPGLAARASHVAAAENFPNGVHVCELEVDPETGRVRIARYVVVDDVGTMINPRIVHGQIHGGVAQGVGEALLEQVVYDEASGQLLSGSFMDYAMPRADDLCSFEVASHLVPTSTNPLGVKGAGEAGVVGALPAVIGAVVDALSPLGIAHIDMPATSERIWQAIRTAGGLARS